MIAAFWFMLHLRKQRYRQRIWQRAWIGRRSSYGAYDTLMKELREEDQQSFINFLRLKPVMFDDLLQLVTPYIQRQDTQFRKAISPGMRLAVTLRFLATGLYNKLCLYMLLISTFVHFFMEFANTYNNKDNIYNNLFIIFPTGETYKSLAYLFRIGNNTIGQFVPETCAAIYHVLKGTYMKVGIIVNFN